MTTHEERKAHIREFAKTSRHPSEREYILVQCLEVYADELHAALEAARAAHAEDRRIIDAALIATRAEVDEQKDLRQSLEAELEAARKCIEAVRAEAIGPGNIGQFLAASLRALEEYETTRAAAQEEKAGQADEGAGRQG
jgi:hypothetical protein